MSEPLPAGALWRSPSHFLALGAGLGLSPRAPGTAGTLLGIPLVLLMPASPLGYALVTVLLFGIGVVVCGACARELDVHDHGGIVFDEVVGYLVTMFLLPTGWPWLLAGFVVFRVFDILKPWPIRLVDRHVHGGFGIMADDVLAGGFALLTLHVAQALLS